MGSLLIDAEDEGLGGKITADNIAYFVNEQRIVRQLERLATVRLQTERHPHPADRGVGKASFCRHRPDRSVRRVDRRRAQCPLDHGSNLIVVDSSRSAGTRLVKQTIAAVLQKSATIMGALAAPLSTGSSCGSLAMLAAMRRASSRVGKLAGQKQKGSWRSAAKSPLRAVVYQTGPQRSAILGRNG